MALYSALSKSYDDFFEAEYLSKLKNKYLLLLKKNGIKYGTLLDAGCGTGLMSLHLFENYYKIIGADISEDMLIQARKKAALNNYTIDFYNCDITKEFPFNVDFDAIISSLDVVNHIIDIKQVESFFLNCYESLKDGGIFLFDINAYKKFIRQYANRKYVHSSHHSVCVWKNNYNAQTELCEMNLEVFTKENDKYIKKTDFFIERYYSLKTIKRIIKKVGFRYFDVITIDKGTRHIICAKKI